MKIDKIWRYFEENRDHWVKGSYAAFKDKTLRICLKEIDHPEATCFCLTGAVLRKHDYKGHPVWGGLSRAMNDDLTSLAIEIKRQYPAYGGFLEPPIVTVISFNDANYRTVEQIIDVAKKADV